MSGKSPSKSPSKSLDSKPVQEVVILSEHEELEFTASKRSVSPASTISISSRTTIDIPLPKELAIKLNPKLSILSPIRKGKEHTHGDTSKDVSSESGHLPESSSGVTGTGDSAFEFKSMEDMRKSPALNEDEIDYECSIRRGRVRGMTDGGEDPEQNPKGLFIYQPEAL